MIKRFSTYCALWLLLGGMILAPAAQAGVWDPFGLFGDKAQQHQLKDAQERSESARARAEQAELEARLAREMAERESERYQRIKTKLSDTEQPSSGKKLVQPPPESRSSLLAEENNKPQKKENFWNKMSPFGWLENQEPEREITSPATFQASDKAAQTTKQVAKMEKQPVATSVPQAKAAILETEKGNITIELYSAEAPKTVANFVKLAQDGFYNQSNMKFHRVVPGFVVQTGDPTGTGAGGSKDRIPLEVANKLTHDGAGVVAMARGPDPNSATSQFYITLAPQKSLDGKYAIFGRVIAGGDILSKIEMNTKLYGVKLVDPSNVARDEVEKKGLFSNFFN